MQLTLASLPHRWRCLAAASPSPALFPTPHTTAVRFGQNRATCQPAASISQSTEMPKRSCASTSTSLTWRLLSVGTLDDKRAVRGLPVEVVRLRHGRANEPPPDMRPAGAAL